MHCAASPKRRRNGIALIAVGLVGVVIALYTQDPHAGMCAVACIAIGYLVLARTTLGFVAFDWIVTYSILVAFLGSTFWLIATTYSIVGSELTVSLAIRNLFAYLLFLCICLFGLRSNVSVRPDSMQFSLFEILVSVAFCSLICFRFSSGSPDSHWKENETHTYATSDEFVTVHIGLRKNGTVDFLVVATFDRPGLSALTETTEYDRKSARTRFRIQMNKESVDPRGTNSCFVIRGDQVTRTNLNLTYDEIRSLIDNKVETGLFMESINP